MLRMSITLGPSTQLRIFIKVGFIYDKFYDEPQNGTMICVIPFSRSSYVLDSTKVRRNCGHYVL